MAGLPELAGGSAAISAGPVLAATASPAAAPAAPAGVSPGWSHLATANLVGPAVAKPRTTAVDRVFGDGIQSAAAVDPSWLEAFQGNSKQHGEHETLDEVLALYEHPRLDPMATNFIR